MLMAVVVQLAGFMADYARVHYASTTVVRKTFTCTAENLLSDLGIN